MNSSFNSILVGESLKIKIAIVTNQMIVGGIENSLISLINSMPKDRFDITVLVMKRGGELLHHLPDEVKIKEVFGNEKTTLEKIRKYLVKGNFLQTIKTILYTLLLKRGTESSFEENLYYSYLLPNEKSKYDIAISYYIPASLPVIYAIKNLNAKIKIAWLHGDVTEYQNSLPKYKKIYEKYHYIFGVSNYVVLKFINFFPHLSKKTSLFYNIINKDNIKLLASRKHNCFNSSTRINLLTVGRLEHEKGQDIIPFILNRLLSTGYDVCWYCIGDGTLREKLKTKIDEFNLRKHLILLGTQDNPYPSIKDCDIYIQPSRHEAYCMTVAEARVFNKPIITTNTGASEQIINGETGLIVKFDEFELFQAIKQLLDNNEMRKRFEQNLNNQTVDSTKEIRKLNKVIKEIC